jgi:hypothetical protein
MQARSFDAGLPVIRLLIWSSMSWEAEGKHPDAE